MTRQSHPSLRTVAVLLVASVSLAGAGCGRKAEPELPTVQAPGEKPQSSPVGMPVGFTKPAPKAEKPAHKPFALDFLL